MKGHKPAKNHPWRKSPTVKVAAWAEKKSKVGTTYTNKVGGGRPSWNGKGGKR